MGLPVYLDYNATTPVAPEVADAMDRATRECWGNPSSAHAYGLLARQAVEQAREEVAALLGCRPAEIVFTGGGTESDNAALVGVAEARADEGRHLVTSNVEHAAVEQACRYLERRGWSVTRVPVDRDGRIAATDIAAARRADTVLVSVMHAQNETGVLQPVRELAASVRPHGTVVHTDAAQSVGKIRVDVEDLGCDLLTLAGHKLYGPKGVGALYVRSGTPLASHLHGAGHEAGRRAGTENVPGIVGLGTACTLARRDLTRRTAHLLELRERLERRLRASITDLVLHGAPVERLPNTLSVAFPGTVAFEVAERARDVATAAGAACHSGKPHVSAVLTAMGVPDSLALATLRLSLGTPTTAEDVDRAADCLAGAVRDLRADTGITRRGS